MERPTVGRIILLFFHRVVEVESVFMSLLLFLLSIAEEGCGGA